MLIESINEGFFQILLHFFIKIILPVIHIITLQREFIIVLILLIKKLSIVKKIFKGNGDNK